MQSTTQKLLSLVQQERIHTLSYETLVTAWKQLCKQSFSKLLFQFNPKSLHWLISIKRPWRMQALHTYKYATIDCSTGLYSRQLQINLWNKPSAYQESSWAATNYFLHSFANAINIKSKTNCDKHYKQPQWKLQKYWQTFLNVYEKN